MLTNIPKRPLVLSRKAHLAIMASMTAVATLIWVVAMLTPASGMGIELNFIPHVRNLSAWSSFPNVAATTASVAWLLSPAIFGLVFVWGLNGVKDQKKIIDASPLKALGSILMLFVVGLGGAIWSFYTGFDDSENASFFYNILINNVDVNRSKLAFYVIVSVYVCAFGLCMAIFGLYLGLIYFKYSGPK